jgi:hypothetical protein
MLTGTILNSNASLNDFRDLGSIEIIKGEQIDLVIRTIDRQTDIRYIPPATAIIKVIFNTSEGDLEKIMTAFTDDRSISKVTLEEVDTESILSGDLRVIIDEAGDGSIIKKGVIVDAIRSTQDC